MTKCSLLFVFFFFLMYGESVYLFRPGVSTCDISFKLWLEWSSAALLGISKCGNDLSTTFICPPPPSLSYGSNSYFLYEGGIIKFPEYFDSLFRLTILEGNPS